MKDQPIHYFRHSHIKGPYLISNDIKDIRNCDSCKHGETLIQYARALSNGYKKDTQAKRQK